jgi:hypothetical protein
MVVEKNWWPEMYVDIKDWVKMCNRFEKRAPLPYDQPLNSLTLSFLWQLVGMDIVYMPKVEDWYLQLVIAWEYCRRWVDERTLTVGSAE